MDGSGSLQIITDPDPGGPNTNGSGSETRITANFFSFLLSLFLGRPLAMGTYPSPKACSSLVVYEDSLLLFGGWTHPSLYPLHQSWKLFNELHLFSVPEKRCDTLPDNSGL
jgi:hypothetical protein